jgi:GTP cyclohydrolase I
MIEGIRTFLDGIGEQFENGHLEETPERVARAWAGELLAGYRTDPAEALTWTRTRDGGGPVVVRDIRLASVCVHHLLPFVGVAHVAYLPGTRLAGLSKIGRVVEALARRLQIQERLTEQIAATLDQVLEPHGVLVMLEAEHTCMTLRGARKENSRLVTLAGRGAFENDPAARGEILRLLGQRPCV